MSITSPPIFSDLVDQSVFVESLGGPQSTTSYLDRFPDSVYSKGIDTSLVRLLYVLLGPVGVGLLRQEYLEARLQIEEANVSGSDLDSLYTSPFAFARLALETYDIDAQASLLPSDQRAQILAYDSSFRNRAFAYFKAIRAGGTVQGIGLAAQSGLNHPVEVFENYKALYDQFADIPLGLPYMGTSTSLNEIIIVPRNDVPQNAQQTITLTDTPVSGFFTLTVPLGVPYVFIPSVSTGISSANLSVPDSSQFPVGAYVTLAPTTNLSGALYAQVGQIINATTVALVYGPDNLHAANTAYVLPNSETYIALVGNAQTGSLPYDATFDQIQVALSALPVVGSANVQVSGGPLPDQPIVVTFVQGLSDQTIDAIQVNTGLDYATGIGVNSHTPEMLDIDSNPDVTGDATVDIAGNSVDGQNVLFSPVEVHNMETAIDILRPVTSFVTTTIGRGVTQRQPASTVFGGSAYTEVLRYATGQSNVPWPPLSNQYWIQSGVEHEAPAPVDSLNGNYQSFHNIASVIAYTEAALADDNYVTPQLSEIQPFWAAYFDTHIGYFSQAQQALFPLLSNYQNSSQQYSPQYAINTTPDRPLITGVLDDNTGVINNNYPATYLGLPGVQQQSLSAGPFWASSERATGGDYLEIDLGSVQAVNFIYFEATCKPYTIAIAYDVLDQAPGRVFAPVTIVSSASAPSVTSLNYTMGATNPWTVVTLSIGNGLGQMIYTRFIRVGFTRNASGPPFHPSLTTAIPYSIEIRNLRIGRNVN